MPYPWTGLTKSQPSPPRAHLPRSRLLAAVGQSRHHKLVLVKAGAGFGKTALLYEYWLALKSQALWYTLDERDRDVEFFLLHLLHGLQQLRLKDLPASLARLDISALADSRTDDLLITIHAMFSAAPRDTFLMFDDYVRVADCPVFNRTLSRLIEQLPSWVHFLIATRCAPSFGVGRLRALRELHEINERDLAFSLHETSRLVVEVERLDLGPMEIRLLQTWTGGWAAGLVMLCAALRHLPAGDRVQVLADESLVVREVSEYLAEEVLAGQSGTVQDFLLRSSILEKLDARLCTELLDLPSAGSVLERLETQGLATVLPTGQIRCHELFRRFLYDRLQRTSPRAEVLGLHARAARLYAEYRDWEQAVTHYCRAGQTDDAAAIIEQIGPTYVEAGRDDAVFAWMQQLPSPLLERRPWLKALLGSCLLRHGKDHDARLALETAAAAFEAVGDRQASAWARWHVGKLAMRGMDASEAVPVLDEALGYAGSDPRLRVGILSSMGVAFGFDDDLVRARAFAESALQESNQLPQNSLTAGERSLLQRSLALACVRAGRIGPALTHARKALAICDQEGLGAVARSWSLCFVGIAETVAGNNDEALAFFAESEECTREDIHSRQRWIGLWRGIIWRDRGDFDRAEADFLLAGPEVEAERGHLRIRQGRAAAALQILASELSPTRLMAGEALTRKATYGLALIACGRLDIGLVELAAAAESFRLQGSGQRAASLELHLCYHEPRAGTTSDRAARLERLANTLSDGGYRHLYWWSPEVVASVCAEALQHQIVNPFVMELAKRSLDGNTARAFFGLLDSSEPAVRRLALSVLTDASERAVDTSAFAAELSRADMDARTRSRIVRAVQSGQASVDVLQSLRRHYDLSWREIEVFLVYYVGQSENPALPHDVSEPELPRRTSCAKELCMSENTLKAHLKNLRRKLGLSDRAGVVMALLRASTQTSRHREPAS